MIEGAAAAAGPIDAADERRRLRALPWLIGALVGLHACMASARVAATLWLLQHGFPESQVGVLLALYGAAPIVLAMPAGRLADRRGFHAPMRWALAMALAGALLMLLVQRPWAMACGALLVGGALSVGAVGVQREASLATSDAARLKQVFASITLGPALSNSLAPVIAGLLIDHVGFLAAFGFAFAMPLLAAWMTSRVPRREPTPFEAAARAAPRRRGATFDLLRLPSLRTLIMVNVALAACWDAHTLVVPVLGHARGLSASQIGLLLGTFAVASTVVRIAITAIGRRFDAHAVLAWAMLQCAVVLALYAVMPVPWGMALGSALLGLALGSVQPMILSLLHQVTPSGRHGEALGVRMVMTNAATLVMPIGFGMLAERIAPAAPMMVMAALVFVTWAATRRGMAAIR